MHRVPVRIKHDNVAYCTFKMKSLDSRYCRLLQRNYIYTAGSSQNRNTDQG